MFSLLDLSNAFACPPIKHKSWLFTVMSQLSQLLHSTKFVQLTKIRSHLAAQRLWWHQHLQPWVRHLPASFLLHIKFPISLFALGHWIPNFLISLPAHWISQWLHIEMLDNDGLFTSNDSAVLRFMIHMQKFRDLILNYRILTVSPLLHSDGQNTLGVRNDTLSTVRLDFKIRCPAHRNIKASCVDPNGDLTVNLFATAIWSSILSMSDWRLTQRLDLYYLYVGSNSDTCMSVLTCFPEIEHHYYSCTCNVMYRHLSFLVTVWVICACFTVDLLMQRDLQRWCLLKTAGFANRVSWYKGTQQICSLKVLVIIRRLRFLSWLQFWKFDNY